MAKIKRAGKCVGKKSYAYSHYAIEVARIQYLKHGVELGFYECPTCLDFHLTSKYCNLKHVHKKWEQKGLEKKPSKSALKRQRKAVRKLLGIPPPPPTPPKPKKVWAGKVSEALKPYTHKTLWQRLWSAIMAK
jgi:hypothetical protein